MENTPEVKPAPKLFPLIVERLRVKHYSKRTEDAIYSGLNAIFFIMASNHDNNQSSLPYDFYHARR